MNTEMSIKINPDEDGYVGRECPDCEKYFKIKFGTGLPKTTDCYCPYCNHNGPHSKFWTKQQLDYAKSVALNRLTGDFLRNLKKIETRPQINKLISIGITVKGSPTPVAYYSEKELEEKVTCQNCSLEYAIYGTFGYCPDCGIHNSLQIVTANFNLIRRILSLSSQTDEAIAQKLIENALEDSISSLDGFGRECFSRIHQKVSFQNIEKARIKIINELGFDFKSKIDDHEWNFLKEQFQKRHLVSHKMGIIDEEFCNKTDTSLGMIGKKVMISSEEIIRLITLLEKISTSVFKAINDKTQHS